MDSVVRSGLIRLAYENPDLRRPLLNIVLGKEFSNKEQLKQYLKEHPKADPKRHTVKKAPKGKTPKEEGGPAKAPTERLKKLFSDDERGMGKGKQKVSDPEELFKAAKESHDHQVGWLNQGKGLDKAIGAKVVRMDKKSDVLPDYTQKGPIIVIGPMKSQARSKEKVEADYGGDWSQLTDAVRASVAVDSLDQIEDVMTKLRASGLKLAKPPKDRFSSPTEVGYRDLMLNVEYPNGHIGELQLHLKPVLQAKEEAHKHYETQRSIGAKAQKEGRTEMTDEEAEQVNEAVVAQKKLYEDAWNAAMSGGEKKKPSKGKKAPSGKKAVNLGGKKFYLYNDAPILWEGKNFPFSEVSEKPIYELDKFFEQADVISESEYEKLVKDTEKEKKSKGGKKNKGTKKKGSESLRSELIRLAFENPELRADLLPLLKEK